MILWPELLEESVDCHVLGRKEMLSCLLFDGNGIRSNERHGDEKRWAFVASLPVKNLLDTLTWHLRAP
jgi:hypothetical protein